MIRLTDKGMTLMAWAERTGRIRKRKWHIKLRQWFYLDTLVGGLWRQLWHAVFPPEEYDERP